MKCAGSDHRDVLVHDADREREPVLVPERAPPELVLRHPVRQQPAEPGHVRAPPRPRERALEEGGRPLAGAVEAVDVPRREVRPRAVERRHEVRDRLARQPVVGVDEHEQLAARPRHAGVARGPEARVLLAHEHEPRDPPRRTLAAIAARRVGRAVVDHHDLEVGERLRAQRREALRQVGLDAVDRHDDADPRHRPYRGRPRGARRSQPPRPRLPPPAPPRGPGDRRCTARRSPRPAGSRPRGPAAATRARSGSSSTTPTRWAAPSARR